MKLENYQEIKDGKLYHDGLDYQDLKEKYGTPLYIFDESSFVKRVNEIKAAMENPYFDVELLFASKALLTRSIAKLIANLEIGQDVVSAGEIHTGIAGGIDPSKMYFHGNNKLDEELIYAVEEGVGTIVLDNRMEAERLQAILKQKGRKQKVLLRLNPGVEAHTHEYIRTAHNSSKFGESIFDPSIKAVIKQISSYPTFDFSGFHSHIGSQVFEEESFYKAASEMIRFASDIQDELGIEIKEINFGGGFGVYYTEGDKSFDISQFLPQFIEHIHQETKARQLNLSKVTIEPGRGLVNASGSTLYTIGDLKQTTSGLEYLFVDGGMTDNIRPALYQAKYEAIITNKADLEVSHNYTIAGKACESGDKLIEDYPLALAEAGDLLLVNGTGAYNYTMANNYNRIPRPAMIHIKDGQDRLTVKRETFVDMIKNEL